MGNEGRPTSVVIPGSVCEFRKRAVIELCQIVFEQNAELSIFGQFISLLYGTS